MKTRTSQMPSNFKKLQDNWPFAKKKKVYCKDCKHCSVTIIDYKRFYTCVCKNSVTMVSSCYDGSLKLNYRECQEINSNFDCKDFEM